MPRMLMLAVITFLCTSLQSSIGAVNTTPAEAWRALSTNERVMWVFGFQQGAGFMAESIEAAVAGGGGSNTSEVVPAEFTPEQVHALSGTIKQLNKSVGEQPRCAGLAEAITRLYEDPANAYIKGPVMVTVAQMQLAGRPWSDIAPELESWRKLSAPQSK